MKQLVELRIRMSKVIISILDLFREWKENMNVMRRERNIKKIHIKLLALSSNLDLCWLRKGEERNVQKGCSSCCSAWFIPGRGVGDMCCYILCTRNGARGRMWMIMALGSTYPCFVDGNWGHSSLSFSAFFLHSTDMIGNYVSLLFISEGRDSVPCVHCCILSPECGTCSIGQHCIISVGWIKASKVTPQLCDCGESAGLGLDVALSDCSATLQPLLCTASQVGLMNYGLITWWNVIQPLKGIVVKAVCPKKVCSNWIMWNFTVDKDSKVTQK